MGAGSNPKEGSGLGPAMTQRKLAHLKGAAITHFN